MKLVGNLGALRCAALALALTGCGQIDTSNSATASSAPDAVPAPSAANVPEPPTGLTADESTSIIYQAGQLIANRTYYDVGLGTVYCSQYFQIGYLKMGDVLLEGNQGKVVITYTVTAVKPIPHFGGAYFPKQCYGEPPEGWSIQKAADGHDEFKVERWQSGWRLAQNQTGA